MFFFPQNSLQYLGNELYMYMLISCGYTDTKTLYFPMPFESWKQKPVWWSEYFLTEIWEEYVREREREKERPPPMKASHIFCVDLIEGHDPSWRPLFTLMHGLHHLLFFGNTDLEWKPFKDSIR